MTDWYKTAVAISLFTVTAFGASSSRERLADGPSVKSLTYHSGKTVDHYTRGNDGSPVLDAVEYEGLYLQAATARRHGRSVVIAVPNLPNVTLTESDGAQRLTVGTDAGVLGRWFFAGESPARVELATGHSLIFSTHGAKIREKLVGRGGDANSEIEFDQGYGRGVYHPVILDLVANQLGLGDDWTARISIRPNETRSLYSVVRQTGEPVAFVVRGGNVNVVYDATGKPIMYDIDLAEQFYPAGPEVAHVPRRILITSDSRAEWEAPQSPDGSIGSAWMPERPEHGPAEVRVRLRQVQSVPVNVMRDNRLVVKPELYQICDTTTVCVYWDGGSDCTTSNYYCDAGTGTGECYIFGTCNSGGSTGCFSLSCGGDSGGSTKTDTSHPNDHIIRLDMQQAVDSAMDGASTKLGNDQCTAVFTKFKNAAGKTMQEVLDGYGVSAATYLTSWMQFNDGRNTSQCTSNGSNYPIYTSPGSRSIWVCVEFVATQRNGPGYAADLLIHEELHSLGLGENPPSSGEITSAVQSACGN